MESHPENAEQFAAALRRFDEENAKDPRQEVAGGVAQPRELLYSRWLTEWVLRLCPQASETLRLAARSQHLCRWAVPRDQFPMTRAGYLRWRETLKRFHAEKTGEILKAAGYSQDLIARVQALNLKKNFPADPESRVLEDALCLTFLERQFRELAVKTQRDKLVNALRKAWGKMSPDAHTLAKQLPYTDQERELLNEALSPPKSPAPSEP